MCYQKSVIKFCMLFICLQSNISLAKSICANCYWGTECGSISSEDVVWYGLINENPGPYYGEQYNRFNCDNGRERLGVLWTAGSCANTGGLSGLSEKQFPGIVDDPNCEFGR